MPLFSTAGIEKVADKGRGDNNLTAIELSGKMDSLLAEGFLLWKESGLPALPESERYFAANEVVSVYDGEYTAELAAACQCYYLFRKLHGMVQEKPAWATLLGDYFFSQFSKYLLPLDSVPLIDAFSAYLKKDTQTAGGANELRLLIRSLPAVLQ